MKKALLRLFATLAVVLVFAPTASAQSYGSEVLEKMSQKLGSLDSYSITFEVHMSVATHPSRGLCFVKGDCYLIQVDGMEQGFDGEKVWMVDAIAEEVTFDRPNLTSHSLFDNPTRAFDFTADLFDVEGVTSGAEEIVVKMSPKEGVLDGVEEVTLVVSAESGLPSYLTYDYGGMDVRITILNMFSPMMSGEDVFTPSIPEGYELIDFR